MSKTEKFLTHIANLEKGCSPSVGYMTEIIEEAQEARREFEDKFKPQKKLEL